MTDQPTVPSAAAAQARRRKAAKAPSPPSSLGPEDDKYYARLSQVLEQASDAIVAMESVLATQLADPANQKALTDPSARGGMSLLGIVEARLRAPCVKQAPAVDTSIAVGRLAQKFIVDAALDECLSTIKNGVERFGKSNGPGIPDVRGMLTALAQERIGLVWENRRRLYWMNDNGRTQDDLESRQCDVHPGAHASALQVQLYRVVSSELSSQISNRKHEQEKTRQFLGAMRKA